MKLMTLAVAVAATVALGHSAQARVHHHRAIHRYEARRIAFHHRRVVRRHFARWREADYWTRRPRWARRTYWTRQTHWAREAYSPRQSWSGGYGPRPAAWCGWEMRHLVGRDPGPAFNLARNWAHWGHGGPAGVGAIVVWPHHVGRIVGRDGGRWVIESGNDGHRLRTRPRSIAGAIAFRWG